jgi:hypothetical protein
MAVSASAARTGTKRLDVAQLGHANKAMTLRKAKVLFESGRRAPTGVDVDVVLAHVDGCRVLTVSSVLALLRECDLVWGLLLLQEWWCWRVWLASWAGGEELHIPPSSASQREGYAYRCNNAVLWFLFNAALRSLFKAVLWGLFHQRLRAYNGSHQRPLDTSKDITGFLYKPNNSARSSDSHLLCRTAVLLLYHCVLHP